MIRNLPEGSRFVSARLADSGSDETERTELDPRAEAVADSRTWTIDRRLKAMEINAIYTQIAVSGHWGKNGPPDFPTVGPAEWRAESKQSKEPKNNFDVLKRMGWPGG
jgi:hypothetical protein